MLQMIFLYVSFVLIIFFVLKVEQQMYVRDVTESFNERVRYEGYITKDMYENYMQQISVNPYRVKFYQIIYEKDSTGKPIETIYTEKQMIDSIYNGTEQMYKLEKGNDFFVLVEEIRPSFYNIIMQMLLKTPARPSVIAYKGGMVFNESY